MLKTIQRKINRQIVNQDAARKQLLQEGKLNALKDTYSKGFDITNANTNKYWNNIFQNEGNLSKQSPMTKDKIASIASFIPEKRLHIIDLGIGQGFLEEVLQKRQIKYDIEGLDISEISIQRAKKKFTGKFRVGNVLEASKFYKKETADLIVAIELLEHINPSSLFGFYNTIWNILKQNGRLIVSIPINEGLELMNNNPSAHVRDYSIDLLTAELQLNNFKIEKQITLYAFNDFYNVIKLASKIFTNHWKPNSLIIVAKKVEKKKSRQK